MGRFVSAVLGRHWKCQSSARCNGGDFSALSLKALGRAELWPNNGNISPRCSWKLCEGLSSGPTMEWFLSAEHDSLLKCQSSAQQWNDFSALSLTALRRAELWSNNRKIFQRCPWKRWEGLSSGPTMEKFFSAVLESFLECLINARSNGTNSLRCRLTSI